MSSILYYSNFCDHSKKLLQTVSKTQVSKDIHFICIDKRERDQNGKVNIILENGQKIIMPENVTKVPALLLISDGFKVLYGDNIYSHLKPKHETATRQATNNNMEPMSFSLGGSGGFGIMSDQYSFLDQDSDALNTKGDGGLRQMHNYVTLSHSDIITTPTDDHKYNQDKVPESMTIEKLQQMREQEFAAISAKR
jgi:hypothetical protein